jgi:stage II sporulation protein M
LVTAMAVVMLVSAALEAYLSPVMMKEAIPTEQLMDQSWN